MAEIARCSKCEASIDKQQENSWCLSCGEALSDEIKVKLPRLMTILTSASSGSANSLDPDDSTPDRAASVKNYDLQLKLGAVGFLVGAVVGFLTRPSAFLVGQLPLGIVITRDASLNGMDQLLVPAAQASFDQLILLGFIGGAIGAAFPWLRARLAESAASPKVVASPVPVPAHADILNNEDVIHVVKAGLSDEIVLAKIQQSRPAFAVSASDLAQLKQNGVSDRLIGAMLQERPKES
jgi:hypothetical protein